MRSIWVLADIIVDVQKVESRGPRYKLLQVPQSLKLASDQI